MIRFFCVSIDLKKLGLSVALLSFSMLLHASSSEDDVAAVEEINKAAVNQQQFANRWTEQQAKSGFTRQHRHQQVKRNIFPPPPPGPYMSSALTNNSVKAPSFSQNRNKSVYRVAPPHVAMDAFSPDRPWPKNLRGDNQQSSANSYRPQVKPNHSNQQYRAASGAPYMRRDGSRWSPSMGFAPNGPYNVVPPYHPAANSNYGAGSARSVYRVQNPVSR